MEDVRLGSSGLKVSRICLGMMSYGDPSREWRLGEEAAEPIVWRAVEAGVTFFDTADMYWEGMSEEIPDGDAGRAAHAGNQDVTRRTPTRHPPTRPPW